MCEEAFCKKGESELVGPYPLSYSKSIGLSFDLEKPLFSRAMVTAVEDDFWEFGVTIFEAKTGKQW